LRRKGLVRLDEFCKRNFTIFVPVSNVKDYSYGCLPPHWEGLEILISEKLLVSGFPFLKRSLVVVVLGKELNQISETMSFH